MNEENVVNFDLSLLNLHELVDVYDNICDFLRYLDENKIEKDNDNE